MALLETIHRYRCDGPCEIVQDNPIGWWHVEPLKTKLNDDTDHRSDYFHFCSVCYRKMTVEPKPEV